MMRRSKRKYNPSAIEQASKRNWNEAWGYHRDQATYWSIAAVCAIGVAGLAVARGWYHDTEPKMIPWVIDRNGPSLLTARLELKIPDAARIEGHLKTWVVSMRTVTSDIVQQNILTSQAFAWISDPSTAHDKLTEMIHANDPRIKGKDFTTDVDVTGIVAQGGDTWLIDWTETTHSRTPGKAVTQTYWRMTVLIHISLPETEEEMMSNWTGVWADDFHIISLPGKTT